MQTLLVPILEAARQLGVGRSTIYSLIASGELPTVKIGRRSLIPVDGLRDYVSRLRAATDGE